MDKIIHGDQLGTINDLQFRDPNQFIAGELHHHCDAWEKLLDHSLKLRFRRFYDFRTTMASCLTMFGGKLFEMARNSNIFGLKRNPPTSVCPVRGIEQYIAIAEQLKINLKSGYLFRTTNQQGAIVNAAFTSSAAEARLRTYLIEMGSDDGETLHGFRSGCAITLALSGVKLSEVMDHVAWTQRHTALYYLQLAKVFNPAGVAQVDLSAVTQKWEDTNELRQFVSAFPSLPSQKRPHESGICI
jgi:hypothetical protein